MNEKIIEALGTELSDQVIQKLKESDIELGITNDGSLVPAGKHEALKTELALAKSELDLTKSEFNNMNLKIEELSKNGNATDELKAQLEEANNKYKAYETETETRLTNIQKKHAIEKGLRDANANPDVLDMLVDNFDLESIQLDKENNIVDWESHLTPVREKRASLFGEVKLQGDTPKLLETNTTTRESLIRQYEQAEQARDVLRMQDLHKQIQNMKS